MQDYTRRKIGAGRKEHGLYILKYLHLPLSQFPAVSLSATSELWHHRLGHPLDARLRTLANTGALGKVTFSPSNNCESCHLAKQTATSFTTSNHASSECFDLIHSDIWGLSRPYLVTHIIYLSLMIVLVILGFILCDIGLKYYKSTLISQI